MANKNLYVGFILSILIITGIWLYWQNSKGGVNNITAPPAINQINDNVQKNLVGDEVVLPVTWGDLGARMVASGVINATKFETIYQNRGGLSTEEKNILYGQQNGQLKINSENSGFVLNLLWALGLGNKNDILENGQMTDPHYGGAGNFASTGGWTIANGQAMDHYSRHAFVALTSEQQNLVYRVAQNIYRPCCGNSTCFPDCNHGMAMLGFLELMASQSVSEKDMYRYALQVNQLWFPDNYAIISEYLKTRGLSLATADPKEILGINYSSQMGYQNIVKQMTSPVNSNGGSCGV